MKINSENKRLYVKINAFMENSQISVNVHIPRVYERLFSQYEHVYKRVLTRKYCSHIRVSGYHRRSVSQLAVAQWQIQWQIQWQMANSNMNGI